MTNSNRSAERRRGIQRTIAGAALAAGLAVGIAAPVAAQEQYPEVGGTTIVQTPNQPGTPAAPARTQVRGTNQSRGTLPVTGGDVAGMAAIGAVLVAGGAIAISSSRRRAAA